MCLTWERVGPPPGVSSRWGHSSAGTTAPAAAGAGANPLLGPPPGSRGGAGSRLPETVSAQARRRGDTRGGARSRGVVLPAGLIHLWPESRPSHRACPGATETNGLWPRGSISRLSGRKGHCLVPGGCWSPARQAAPVLLTDGSLCAKAFHSPGTSWPHRPPRGRCSQPAGFVGGRQGADGPAVSPQEVAVLGAPAPAPTPGPPLL